jgi:hypothetical protein
MDTPVSISDRNKPARQTKHLTIGALILPRMDQIDFTGPFESRMRQYMRSNIRLAQHCGQMP